MSTTRLEQIGIGAAPYKVFDPKAPAGAGVHDPGVITRLCQAAVGAKAYAVFQAKTPAGAGVHAPGIITRLGQPGVGLAVYLPFSPKTPSLVIIETTVIAPAVTVGWPKKRRKKPVPSEIVTALPEIHWPGMIWPTGKRSTGNVPVIAAAPATITTTAVQRQRQIPIVPREVARKMGLALGKRQQAIFIDRQRDDEDLLLLLGAFD